MTRISAVDAAVADGEITAARLVAAGCPVGPSRAPQPRENFVEDERMRLRSGRFSAPRDPPQPPTRVCPCSFDSEGHRFLYHDRHLGAW